LHFPLDGPRTLNGLLLEHLEAMPEAGVSVLIAGYPVEVVQVQDRMVKTAKIGPSRAKYDWRRPWLGVVRLLYISGTGGNIPAELPKIKGEWGVMVAVTVGANLTGPLPGHGDPGSAFP
jgi:hypothetical protein